MFKHLKKPLSILALTTIISFPMLTEAALYDRGGGLIYDDVLNVTWLQDANYAKTSGYDNDGLMTWNTAMDWATNLEYGGFDDWRLTTNLPLNNSSFSYLFAENGTADRGYNITSPLSELSYMFYVNLMLNGFFDVNGSMRNDYGLFGNGTWNGIDGNSFGEKNIGLINNYQALGYWSSSNFDLYDSFAFYFSNILGAQDGNPKDREIYAWAVRDGDVLNTVPEPSTLWLVMFALFYLKPLKISHVRQ